MVLQKLYEDVTTFESEIGSATDLGFKMAKKLLGLGMKVQYVVYAREDDLKMQNQVQISGVHLKIKELYDLRLLLVHDKQE